MEMAADRDAGLAHGADLFACGDLLSLADGDLRKMSIQGVKVVCVLDDNQVSVKITPGRIDRRIVRPGIHDDPLPCCIDRGAKLVQELHAAVRVARPVGGGGEAIGHIYRGIRRWKNRALKEEVAVRDAVLRGRRVTGLRRSG